MTYRLLYIELLLEFLLNFKNENKNEIVLKQINVSHLQQYYSLYFFALIHFICVVNRLARENNALTTF